MLKYNEICHANFAKSFRGGERQTLLLIEELSQKGYKQVIFTREKSQLAKRLLSIKNLTIIQIKKPYIFSLRKVNSNAIIHAHETKAAQFAYFAHLCFGNPYIITRRVVNPISKIFFNRAIYLNSKYTIALSTAIKEQILELNQNVNIKIIPDAFSNLEYKTKEVQNLKNKFKNKFIIGSIGELDNDTKGQLYLIEALKMLEKDYKEIHLILLGKGKDFQLYKDTSKDMTNISIEGFVNNVGDYLQCFNLFVFPSIKEGLGSSLLDVMNFEIPIIATNTGGIPDIIKDDFNGVLIEMKNTQAIYDAILKLYHNKELVKKYTDNAKNNLKNYHITSITSSYEACYNIEKEILQ